jgi:hypothetical protein
LSTFSSSPQASTAVAKVSFKAVFKHMGLFSVEGDGSS